MANRRVERLNEQLRREISDILRRDVRDPRVGVPTVTRVEVTPDLWMARVFVRAVGSGLDRQEALVGLDAAAPFVGQIESGSEGRPEQAPLRDTFAAHPPVPRPWNIEPYDLSPSPF